MSRCTADSAWLYVSGDPGACVAETVEYALQVGTCAQGQGGACVTEIVESNPRQIGSNDVLMVEL